MLNPFNPLLWIWNLAAREHAKHLREQLAADVARRVVDELEQRHPHLLQPKKQWFTNHRQQVDW